MGSFSKEIQSGRMFDLQALGLPTQTMIQIAWIDLEESVKRSDPRDEWKLAHWDQYTKRRIEPHRSTLLYIALIKQALTNSLLNNSLMFWRSEYLQMVKVKK
ncbi:hypothetical protein [Polynucleobacter necessarius]|uniref:hypothetical protein n=1 Tax=Polynucleobacter necessarius TaxID=576610 RepID=UPI001E5296E6|nr:hypothetical protein [Polynucleobacter necessarius]